METATRIARGEIKTQEKEIGKVGRNIWCPEYDTCLSKAAFGNLPLDCNGCPSSSQQLPLFVLTMSEIEGCKALIKAIFGSSRDGLF